jgi:hypothetical protein
MWVWSEKIKDCSDSTSKVACSLKTFNSLSNILSRPLLYPTVPISFQLHHLAETTTSSTTTTKLIIITRSIGTMKQLSLAFLLLSIIASTLTDLCCQAQPTADTQQDAPAGFNVQRLMPHAFPVKSIPIQPRTVANVIKFVTCPLNSGKHLYLPCGK